MKYQNEDAIDKVIDTLVDDDDLAEKLKEALHTGQRHVEHKSEAAFEAEDFWENVPV